MPQSRSSFPHVERPIHPLPAARRPLIQVHVPRRYYNSDDHPTSVAQRTFVGAVCRRVANDRERRSSPVVSGDGSGRHLSTDRERVPIRRVHARPPGLALVITALCRSGAAEWTACVRSVGRTNGQPVAAGRVIGRCPAVVILPGYRPQLSNGS